MLTNISPTDENTVASQLVALSLAGVVQLWRSGRWVEQRRQLKTQRSGAAGARVRVQLSFHDESKAEALDA